MKLAAMAAVAAAFTGMMVAGIAGLREMANATVQHEAVPPVPVMAKAVPVAPGYTVHERFVGRLEPARQTRLSFERSGRVTEVLVEEGDHVKKGDPLARLDVAKLEAERAMLTARRRELDAQRQLSELTVGRKKKLMDAGHGAIERYDEARFALAGLVAAIENVDASLASLDVDIAKSVVHAPFSGQVGARLVDEGAVVSPNAPVVDLLEVQRRQVRIGVSAEAAASLTPDRTYTLQAAGRDFSATLAAVRPDVSASTRTVAVLFDVDNAQALPFGEVLELVLDRFVTEPGYWVPLSALTEGRKGLWTVFTLDRSESPYVVRREAVEVLYAERSRAFVRGTLKETSLIVMDGTNRVVPGQQVALAQKAE